MTVIRALLTVVGTAVAFGVAGGAIGFGLGKFTPSFYRHVFHVHDDQNINPEELGLGLGVTNGLVWGLIVGLVVVLIITWYELRRARLRMDEKHPLS
jgi:predicted DNA repair protein MutK